MKALAKKKVAVFGIGLAWLFMLGNLLLFMALIYVLPIYRSMSGNEFGGLDYLLATLYVVDAAAAVSMLFGRPMVTTVVFVITSTISFALSDWLHQAPSGQWLIYGPLSLVVSYWDVAVLVYVSKKQREFQQLLESKSNSS